MNFELSHITLSELQRRIKTAIEEAMPLPVWIVAEISEVKVNRTGHCYMELVEKPTDNHTANTQPAAQARAVIWRQQWAMLSAYFRAATGSDLMAGMKILAKVIVSYHELYGLSLQITDLDASYTLGEAERQKQLTIEQLKADGVWGRREDGGPAGGNQKTSLARALLPYPGDSKESWSDTRSLFWKEGSGYR